MDRSSFGISCTMKHERKLFGKLLRATGLPQDLDPHRFFVQWIGGAECLIEQHRGIVCFGKDGIRFQTEQGTLCVEGENLELLKLSETRAIVRGPIRAVSVGGKS